MKRVLASVGVVLLALTLVLASPTCENPTAGQHITRSTIFCSGTYVLDEPITIDTNDIVLTCDKTELLGTDSGSGLVVRGATGVVVKGCTFRLFRDAVYVTGNASVVFDDVRAYDSVRGVAYEDGAQITGRPLFENVAFAMAKLTAEEIEERTLEEFQLNATPIARRVVLFQPSNAEILLLADQHHLSKKTVARTLAQARVVRKDARVGRTTTEVTLVFEGLKNGQKLFVYEILGGYTMKDSPEQTKTGEGFVVFPVTLGAAGEHVTITYTLEGAAEDIDETPPITVLSTESPWWREHRNAVVWGIVGVLVLAVIAGGIVWWKRMMKKFP